MPEEPACRAGRVSRLEATSSTPLMGSSWRAPGRAPGEAGRRRHADTVARCRRSTGSAATCAWRTTRRCSPRSRPRGPTTTRWCRCSSSIPCCGRPPAHPGWPTSPRSLRALDESLGGRLVVRHGRARDVVPAVMAEVGAAAVHVTAATEPYGRRRDEGLPLVRTGSPYAVAPGPARPPRAAPRSRCSRRSAARGWTTAGRPRHPARPAARGRTCAPTASRPRPTTDVRLPPAGEAAALRRWHEFLRDGLATYATDRDRPDLDGTSRLSIPLKYGELHPRTLLADLPAVRRHVPLRAGLARVPRRRPLAPPVGRAHVAAHRRPRRLLGHRPGRARRVRGLGRGPHRVPDRRRRDAPAAGAGLDAQPRPHGRRVVPGQGPARALAARRRALHGVAGRRRRGAEPAELAVGGGHGPRRRAVLPRVQPGDAGRRSSTRPGPTSASGCPSCGTSPARAVHEPWKLRTPPAGYPAPIVDHATERRVALDDFHRARDSPGPAPKS